MKKFDSILLKIFFYECPIIFIFMCSYTFFPLEALAKTSFAVSLWYNICGGVIFLSWILIAVYISIKMLLSHTFRHIILSKITFMRERDEREIFMTGQAAKNTMLTTLAILIFLFCLSCFNFSYKTTNNNSHDVSWGISFSLTNETNAAEQPNNDVSYSGLPISNSIILLGLIGLQIFSYNHYMKRRE